MQTVMPVVCLLLTVAAVAFGETPTESEQQEARRLTGAKFLGEQDSMLDAPGIYVIANLEDVQPNARHGKPLNLAGKEYTSGLYCHAVSKVVVNLPGPGKTFRAVVGVDSNEQTSGGRGSVVFRVLVRGKEAFCSPVVREGMAGLPVEVNLDNSEQLTLEVGPGSDGISCDQADWADAVAVLADGKEIRFGDLPITNARASYSGDPPFDFVYNGRPFGELRSGWEFKRNSKVLDGSRTQHTLTWRDPATHLLVRCVAVQYADYPMVEWTVYLRNEGKANTPMVESLHALDLTLSRGNTGEFLLHHNVGSLSAATDYRPLETALGPGATTKIGSNDGWPTSSSLSYMNLDWGGKGMIIAVGWPGQWTATFQRDAGAECRVVAGQGRTHFVLHPDEEVRTPLIVLQPWEGDRDHAQNVWRRWMMAHNLPRPGGAAIKPMLLATSSRVFEEMMNANEANQKLFIDRYLEEGLKIDYWWMDAGWYTNMGRWGDVGTWEVDRKRFPNGLKAISDHAHSKGVKTLVWFEPERVAPKTWLAENKPEWILKSPTFSEDWGRLLNLGNPAAWEWLMDRVDGLIKSEGIDLYRQDFNIPPLSFWEAADAEDRQGITENRYVIGHLAFWDELRKRHPNMIIDNCASGGRRLDLESVRRGVPLWRSDYAYEPVGEQCITYGISAWIPYHGTGTTACANVGYYSSGKSPVEPYAFWSNVAPSTVCTFDVQVPDLDYAAIRKLVASWREISADYVGDYYPLTAYSGADDQWMAWQFNRPEIGRGFVQVFRRAGSPYTSAAFPLKGMDPEAKYSVCSIDAPGKATTLSGKSLMGSGLPVSFAERPAAAVMTYRRIDGK